MVAFAPVAWLVGSFGLHMFKIFEVRIGGCCDFGGCLIICEQLSNDRFNRSLGITSSLVNIVDCLPAADALRQLPTRDSVAAIGIEPLSSRSTLNCRLFRSVVV